MCIDFDGHHFGGSSFVYVNNFCYYKNCLYTHRYKFSSEQKKKTGKESESRVSHLGPGSDPPFRSDRDSGRDRVGKTACIPSRGPSRKKGLIKHGRPNSRQVSTKLGRAISDN